LLKFNLLRKYFAILNNFPAFSRKKIQEDFKPLANTISSIKMFKEANSCAEEVDR